MNIDYYAFKKAGGNDMGNYENNSYSSGTFRINVKVIRENGCAVIENYLYSFMN